jgi:hypothetical protein
MAIKDTFQNLLKSSIQQANEASAWIEGYLTLCCVIPDDSANVSNVGTRGNQNTITLRYENTTVMTAADVAI